MSDIVRVTVEAPINIAFIKYWGKRDGGEELILPANDSFSVTLSTRPFRTHTTVELRNDIADDELILNGQPQNLRELPRLLHVLRCVREGCASARKQSRVRIISENNFPTAAGMASSASGYSALAAALVKAFQSTMNISLLARLGSGSACRSVYGGFVIWHKGEKSDGADCVATQFADEYHWPEMQILCAVVQGEQKSVSSTRGMQESMRTSPMMPERVSTTVAARMQRAQHAIRARDFATFAAIAMSESDDLQEICRTTVPTIQYASEDSYALIRLLRAYNAKKGQHCAAYTFDAGANCFIFVLETHVAEVVALLRHYFPTDSSRLFFHNAALLERCLQTRLTDDLCHLIDVDPHSLTMLLQSPVGSGVVYLEDTESNEAGGGEVGADV